MVPVPALSQTRAMAVLRLPVAYVRGLGGHVHSLSRALRVDGEGLRLLRRVRVVRRRVDLELREHLAAEDVLGEHPLHGLLDRELRLAREQVAVALGPEAARDARVAVVELLVELVAVSFTLSALTTMTKSPVSSWVVKVGLCLPRKDVATSLARRPRGLPVASTTHQERPRPPVKLLYLQ
jgi:hypothetical protein